FRMATKFLLLPAFAVMICLPPPASAEDFNFKASLGLHATAGLDEKTIALLQDFPKELKEQLLELLKGALPLIDTSVLTYMNRVNEILDIQINHLQCAAEGTIKTLGGTLKETIGITPSPVQDLETDQKSTIASFSIKDSPDKYLIK